MSADPPGEPALFMAMERRRRELGIRSEGLMHARTRAKIRAGEPVRSDVYDGLDRMLRWEPGSAERTAAGFGPPRPLDPGSPTRQLHLTRQLSAAASAAAGGLDEETLAAVEALADQIWQIINVSTRPR